MTSWSVIDALPESEHTPRINRASTEPVVPNYARSYESFVDHTVPVRILQIGNFYVDSISTWRNYLHPDSTVIVADINAKLIKVGEPQRQYVSLGAEETVVLLQSVTAAFGPFDVIVDSGSCTSRDMITCFSYLFVEALASPGNYLVEGACSDFWTLHGQNSPSNYLEIFVDALHGHYRIVKHDDHSEIGRIIRVTNA